MIATECEFGEYWPLMCVAYTKIGYLKSRNTGAVYARARNESHHRAHRESLTDALPEEIVEKGGQPWELRLSKFKTCSAHLQ